MENIIHRFAHLNSYYIDGFLSLILLEITSARLENEAKKPGDDLLLVTIYVSIY